MMDLEKYVEDEIFYRFKSYMNYINVTLKNFCDAQEEINKMPLKKGKVKSSKGSSSKTSTATKTATATKTSTDAYTQGNITVTGGAGKGPTNVTIAVPGGALPNRGKKPSSKKPSMKKPSRYDR